MRAGLLREPVEQLRLTRTDDGGGGGTDTWAVVRSMRMQVIPIAGLEQYADAQLQVRATHKFKGRYVSDLTVRDRLRMSVSLREFDITEVIVVREKSREMIVRTVERQAT